MKVNKMIPLLLSMFLLSSCAFHGFSTEKMVCENRFYLTDDFKHIFPNQGNYFNFIKSSLVIMYYYENSNNNNCRYYLEYLDGKIVDEWGYYKTNGRDIHISLNNGDKLEFIYSYYNSPTIDYILLGDLTYNGVCYTLVYYALYLYSTKG